jgi:competence protein ComEC
MYHEPSGILPFDQTPHRPGWMSHLAIAAMVGITVGSVIGSPILWMSLCAALLAVAGFVLITKRPDFCARYLILAACVCGFANWYQVSHRYLPADDIRQYAQQQSQLIDLTGTIVSPTHFSTPKRGALGQFSYQSPATLFVMQVDTITKQGKPQSASGKTLVKIEQIDPSLAPGDRLRITGWFRQTQGPSNPGEYDYQRMLAQQDIHTRVTLKSVANVTRLESLGGLNHLRRFRGWCAQRASDALSLGIKHNSKELGLLQIMLLGQRGGNLDELDDAFREVGLAHLLSISGAHLGILLYLSLFGAILITQYPRRQIWIVTAVLIFYMIVVPTRVPIARAGVMAGAFCFCSLTGLIIGRINILGLATLVVLLWRPADLFTPGFQLSFGTVAGLAVFVPNVSKFLYPDPRVMLIEHTRHRIARKIADYFAVNIVAFCVALPLVAYHYQMICPWNMVLTMLALPMVTMMLGLGFLKIMLGMFFPSIGLLLSGLTGWATQMLASLVQSGRGWPLASIGLGAGPSVWWMLSALMVVFALFCGVFRGRRKELMGMLVFLCVWLAVPMMPTWRIIPVAALPRSTPIATLRSVSMGNGSCYIVQLKPTERWERDYVLMFDCGSQQFLDAGKRSVLPVLENLNIRQIDCLMLSHADIDHYGGALDVADGVTVKEVLLPQHMLDDAKANPRKATANLLKGLEDRQIPIHVVQAGWTHDYQGHALELIWPPLPSEFPLERDNDSSLVLSIKTHGKRILLNGDIQQRAITTMLNRGMDLKADITDLAHHGSVVKATPDWLEAVKPEIAIQSAGWARLYSDRDKWPGLFKQAGLQTQRLVTAPSGMVSVHITIDGSIEVERFIEP